MTEEDGDLTVRLADGVASIDADSWNACAGDDNPFVDHRFLAALEESGSVGPGTGWQPSPILVERDDNLIAALPAYIKIHSQGEYVFDHSWADAFSRAGGDYYPKLQIASPFSPVPGPRILARAGEEVAAGLAISGAQAVVDQNGLSSAHATFVLPEQVETFRAAGWLIRQDTQYHWRNRGYGSFDDFLADLSSSKRKTIRKERAQAVAGLEIQWLTGAEIEERHWEAFWFFYQDTGARKWGRPYLTRSFFSLLGERMGEKVVLMLALRDGEPIAGALNLVGKVRLYGRYWGCTEEVPHLHFELCYYQAIDYAIAHKLDWVEAGAQGEHKLARGYGPEPTWSAHYLADPRFRAAVGDFLEREREAVEAYRALQMEALPFKKA